MLKKFLSLFKKTPAPSEEARKDAVTVLSSPFAKVGGKERRRLTRLRHKIIGRQTRPKPAMIKFAVQLRGRTAAQLIKMHRRQCEEIRIARQQKARKIKGILSGCLPDPTSVLKQFEAQLAAIENELLSRGMLITAGENS